MSLSVNVRFVYMTTAAIIFLTEIAIAAGAVGGAFVRGSIGDVLVIALIYFFIRAISSLFPGKAAGTAIAIGFFVEALQYIHVAELINIRKGSFLYIIVGNTFSLSDLFMYVVGGVLALLVDQYVIKKFFTERWVTNKDTGKAAR